MGNADDVASVFEIVNATVVPTSQDIELKFRIRLEDPDLNELVSTGQARLVFAWTCGSTLSSGVLEAEPAARHADGITWRAWLDQQMVRHSVTVEARIVSSVQNSAYSLREQHPDYGNQTFAIRPGDVLGVAGSFEFEADKLYDPLNPPVGSCFRFVEEPKQQRGLQVRFTEDDQVLVLMSTEMLHGLHALGNAPELQVALVVLPAVVETLLYIQNNEQTGDEDASGKRWYETMLQLANQKGGMDGPSILPVAQKILDHPIDKALQFKLSEEDDD
ncbi:hypothetical protein [Propioniciclava sinopodophylli]|uniref:hypothetical protein n=1 Tax=Propioniciclava sinopodophylli TaxID=1837344 RepID=UPI002491CD86|nr:hypothetical protein [Propioniciclava sinopodophylli]